MTIKARFILVAFLSLSAYTAQASVTLSFAAGVVRQENGNPVPLGSLGILVADTSGNGFGTSSSLVGSTLNTGSSLGGSDNLILSVFTATDTDGIIGFNSSFSYSIDTLREGVPLMFFWFPTISAVGVTLQTGVNYGSYRTDSTDTNSGSEIGFVSQADTTRYALNVFDDFTAPGSLATVANLTALNFTAIPEPSSVALLAAGGALVAGRMLRRRKNG